MTASQTTQAIDVTHADCLRTVSDVGSSTVMNICSGVSHVVPWGSADWLGFAAISALVLVLGAMIAVLVVMVGSSIRNGY